MTLQTIWSDQADRILSVGVWLGPEHRNWALTKEQALTAFDCLCGANFIVLGGDVLNGPEESYSHTYDNWHFEPSPSPEGNPVSLSALAAKAYVRNYPRGDVYFVIVPSAASSRFPTRDLGA
jgi:hypothetical protein